MTNAFDIISRTMIFDKQLKKQLFKSNKKRLYFFFFTFCFGKKKNKLVLKLNSKLPNFSSFFFFLLQNTQ